MAYTKSRILYIFWLLVSYVCRQLRYNLKSNRYFVKPIEGIRS